jgi:hypothetical protein
MTLIDLSTLEPFDQEGPEEARGSDGVAPALDRVVLPGLSGNPRKYLTAGIRKRRGTPIMGYNGLNGDGKSFCMVRDTLADLAAGRRVLSTVALLDPHTGNNHPLYTPFRHWSQLDDWRDGPILLDEVTGVMDSRESGMPKKVRKKIPQMRRANAPIRWTGINWDNSDRRLRQITKAVTICRGFLPKGLGGSFNGSADSVEMWLPNRLFLFTTYDTSTMNQSEDGQQLTQDDKKKNKAKVKKRELVWGPKSLAFDCYNTLDAVDSIDNSCAHVDPETGHVCGGRIPEKTCKGHV